jgi:hypothetical protein
MGASTWPVARAGALAVTALLAGCSSETPAYVKLQDSIKSSIVQDDHRPVDSVACTPHVKSVSYGDGIVHLNCHVRLKDESAYDTRATIEARSYQVAGYRFGFDEPGPLDITRARLPRPRVPVPATSAQSLFFARNLRPVVKALAKRFGNDPLILSLALYPGELEAVIETNGEARLVTAHTSGALTVGPATPFEGQRSGITISQLDPRVPQQLARRIAARGGVPISGLDRLIMVLLPHNLAGWDIYPATGVDRFRAHIDGPSLEKISPSGTRPLG